MTNAQPLLAVPFDHSVSDARTSNGLVLGVGSPAKFWVLTRPLVVSPKPLVPPLIWMPLPSESQVEVDSLNGIASV